MARKSLIDDISINSMIGADSRVDGNVSVAGLIRIDGNIDGDVTASGKILMGEGARIRGNVTARSISVGGMIYGDVIAADGVSILSSGMVIGTIITTSLVVEDNVILHGFCSAVNDYEHFEKMERQYRNKQALQSSGFSNQGR